MADENATVDFPAAHSMDTTWFGVDDDGEIAVFESGEDGAVPNAFNGPPDSTSCWDLFKGCPADDNGHRRVPIDGAPLAALCAPALLYQNLASQKARRYVSNLVVLYANEEAVLSAISKGPSASWYEPLRFAGPDIVVLYQDAPELPWVEEAIASGGIIGLGPATDGSTRLDAEAVAQGLLVRQLVEATGTYSSDYRKNPDDDWPYKFMGMHFYSADYTSTVYEASYRPHAGVKIDDLIGGGIRRSAFVPFRGVRFADAAAIQPVALMPCSQWGAQWAGADGSLHLRQNMDGNVLRDENGAAFDPATVAKMAVRPIGALPVEIDYDNWDKLGEVQPAPAPRPTPSVPGRASLLGRWFGFGKKNS
jgi:hypothetical protein